MQQRSPVQNISHRERLLIVEDNPDDAKLLTEYLSLSENHDFEIEIKTSLQDALEALSRQDFACITLDLSLPDCSGIDTFSKVAAQSRSTPKLIITGGNDASIATALTRHGASDVLPKDELTPTRLYNAICTAIDRSATATSYPSHFRGPIGEVQESWDGGTSRVLTVLRALAEGQEIVVFDIFKAAAKAGMGTQSFIECLYRLGPFGGSGELSEINGSLSKYEPCIWSVRFAEPEITRV